MSLADRSMRIYNLLLVQYSSDLYCSTTSTTTRSVYNEKRDLTGPNSGYILTNLVRIGTLSFPRAPLGQARVSVFCQISPSSERLLVALL